MVMQAVNISTVVKGPRNSFIHSFILSLITQLTERNSDKNTTNIRVSLFVLKFRFLCPSYPAQDVRNLFLFIHSFI